MISINPYDYCNAIAYFFKCKFNAIAYIIASMSEEPARREIGGRLKQARKARGYSQRGFAEEVGMPLPSYRDYEGNKRIPGGEALERFARAGIDTHWLLTGQATVHEARGEYRARPENRGPDTGKLREVLEAVETALEENDHRLSPSRKAELIAALYELCAQSSEPPSPAAVRRLIRSI